MIAVMAKSGLRVTEMCQLRWRDVDVHHQRLIIREAKTDAGVRDVDLSLDVMEELMAWRASRRSSAGDEVRVRHRERPPAGQAQRPRARPAPGRQQDQRAPEPARFPSTS